MSASGLSGSFALGAGLWAVLLAIGKLWLLPPAPPPPPAPTGPTPAQVEHARQADAELDSSLQLAVSRARRAKDEGRTDDAIDILQQALREAGATGRSVAHVQVHWLLGWLYADRGDRGAAMAMFRSVAELSEPGSQYYEQASAAFHDRREQAEDEQADRASQRCSTPGPTATRAGHA